MANGEKRITEILARDFPDVERLGRNRFMVWGPSQARNRLYVEIWVDDDFLEQENSDFEAWMASIVSEVKGMLNDPDRGINKRGEILISSETGIEIRRGGDTFSVIGAN